MKIFSKIAFIIVLLCSLGFSMNTNAWFIKDLINSGTPNIGICQWDDECWIPAWVDQVKKNLNGVEKEKPASQYIQDVIVYLIGFLSIIAVVYIIYAGFNILTGTGDEEKVKKSKSIIIYVVAWLAIIYLAYSIVAFVFNVFDQAVSVEAWIINEHNIFM